MKSRGKGEKIEGNNRGMTHKNMKRQHQPRPCPEKFLKNQARASIVREASINSALWRDIQAVVFQQSKDQPDQFSGS